MNICRLFLKRLVLLIKFFYKNILINIYFKTLLRGYLTYFYYILPRPQVFLLTSRSRGAMTQRVLLRRLRTHVILSVIWLLWSILTQVFLVSTSFARVVSFLPEMQVWWFSLVRYMWFKLLALFMILFAFTGAMLFATHYWG